MREWVGEEGRGKGERGKAGDALVGDEERRSSDFREPGVVWSTERREGSKGTRTVGSKSTRSGRDGNDERDDRIKVVGWEGVERAEEVGNVGRSRHRVLRAEEIVRIRRRNDPCDRSREPRPGPQSVEGSTGVGERQRIRRVLCINQHRARTRRILSRIRVGERSQGQRSRPDVGVREEGRECELYSKVRGIRGRQSARQSKRCRLREYCSVLILKRGCG